MRDEQTMALICFSGVSTANQDETHVQICLGTEGGAPADVPPYFFTVTIAGADSSRTGEAQRHRITLGQRDIRNLRRWIEQVQPPDQD